MRLPGILAGAAAALLSVMGSLDDDDAFEQVARIEKALCADRSPCRIHEIHEAGKDAKGRDLMVVELALHDREGDDWKQPDLTECAPWEVWRIKGCKKGACDPVKLLTLCNDGMGASGVGEDTLAVEDNLLTHGQYGGSAWRWYQETTWQLDPLKVVATQDDTYHNLSAVQHSTTWDLETWMGWVSWYSPQCPDEAWGELDDEDLYGFQPIPSIQAPESYLEQDWKITSLGSCSVRIDAGGTAGSGWVVQGEPSSPGDGALRAVLVSGTVLVIEVRDDAFISAASGAAAADQVHVWVGQGFEEYGQCIEPQPPARQWIIDVADGSVQPGDGDPRDPVVVERQEVPSKSGKVVRLKVTLDEPPGRITVAYSDTDDGLEVERLLATSRLDPSTPLSMGTATAFPGNALCVVKSAILDFID